MRRDLLAAQQQQNLASATIPFRLQARFTLYTLDGKPRDEGTFVWDLLSNGTQQQISTIGSYKRVHVSVDGRHYDKDELQRGELLLNSLLGMFFNPLPPEDLLKKSVGFSRQLAKVGDSSLDCISFSAVGMIRDDSNRNMGFNQGQAYCLNPTTHVLHATQAENGYAARFANFVSFAGHVIPREVDLLEAGFQSKSRLRAKLEITSLKSAPDLTAEELRKSLPPGELEASGPAYRKVIGPEFVSGVRPTLPKSMVGIQDVNEVVMMIRINEQGRVADVEPVNATSPMLVDVAEDAIRDWRYKPATVDGKPVPYNLRYTMRLLATR
jgi:hypothetical protein